MLVFLLNILTYIIIAIVTLFIIVIFSCVKIKVKELEYDNSKLYYNVNIGLYFLGVVKYFGIKLDENFIKKINAKKIISDMNVYNFRRNLKNQFGKIKMEFDRLNMKIEKFNMELLVGTEDVLITSAVIFAITTAFPFLVRNMIKRYNPKKHYYIIRPVYNNKNMVNLTLNCIINVRVVHIIYVIILLIRRRGFKYERTSDRRIDDDSDEQYSGYDRCKHNYRRTN